MMAVIEIEPMKHTLELLVAPLETRAYLTICACGWHSPYENLEGARGAGREHLVEMVGRRFIAFWLLDGTDHEGRARGRLLRRGHPNHGKWFPYKNRADGAA
jgi:hypothetical protein